MRRRYILHAWRSERGSQGLEAAGAALAAALIVLALLAGARSAMGPQVLQAFQCAAAALVGGGGCGDGGAVADGTGTAPQQAGNKQDKGGFSLLDGIQIGLDVVGVVPGFGEVADGVNGLISLARGDTTGAALSFAAMVPFAGWAATGGKWARTGAKLSDEVAGATRYGDEAATAGRRGDDIPIGCGIGQTPGGKGPGLAKPLAGCKEIGPNPDVSKLKRKLSRPDPNKPERGTWDGDTFHPINPKAKPGETPLSEKYPDGVTFDKDGFPDFTSYARVNPKTGQPDVYQIKMEGNYGTGPNGDFGKANRAAGYTETPDGYTWHHHQDRKTMILVPKDIHGAVAHTGGTSVIKELGTLP